MQINNNLVHLQANISLHAIALNSVDVTPSFWSLFKPYVRKYLSKLVSILRGLTFSNIILFLDTLK